MSVTEMLNDMMIAIQDAIPDAKKFDAGNNAAGVRVRKAMQDLKLAAQGVREEVSKVKAAK